MVSKKSKKKLSRKEILVLLLCGTFLVATVIGFYLLARKSATRLHKQDAAITEKVSEPVEPFEFKGISLELFSKVMF